MDDFLKFKFENLFDICEFDIDNYPLYLNSDGCTLIVKDKSEKPRDPTEEEISLYCKPRNSVNKKTLGNSASNSTIESSGSSDTDAVTAKKFNSKIKSMPKDKGLVITVKKNNVEGNLIEQKNVIQEE